MQVIPSICSLMANNSIQTARGFDQNASSILCDTTPCICSFQTPPLPTTQLVSSLKYKRIYRQIGRGLCHCSLTFEGSEQPAAGAPPEVPPEAIERKKERGAPAEVHIKAFKMRMSICTMTVVYLHYDPTPTNHKTTQPSLSSPSPSRAFVVITPRVGS